MAILRLQTYQLGIQLSTGHSWGWQLILCLTMACYTKPFTFSTAQPFIVLPDKINLTFEQPAVSSSSMGDLPTILSKHSVNGKPNNLHNKEENKQLDWAGNTRHGIRCQADLIPKGAMKLILLQIQGNRHNGISVSDLTSPSGYAS